MRKNHAMRHADVLLFDSQPVRPGRRQIRGHVLGVDEPREVLGVAPLDLGRGRLGVQKLGRELADRREHPEPRLGAGRVDADEAVTRQHVEHVERVVLVLRR